MSSTDNETFQLLLEEIKKMNKNLETASFAINNLTMQMNSRPNDVKSIKAPAANAEKTLDNSYASDNTEPDDSDGNQTPHIHGYVNWDSSHDILQKQKLVKMSTLRDLLTKMESTIASHCKALVKDQQQKFDTYGRAITSGQVEQPQAKSLYHFTSLYTQYTVINREIRFPLDAVYLNVDSADVKKEIDFMNKLNVQPTDGVIERFLTICENEMLTCEGFEKKYGLKWV